MHVMSYNIFNKKSKQYSKKNSKVQIFVQFARIKQMLLVMAE